MRSQYLYFIALILILGCNPSKDYDFEYDIIITDMPANLQGLNSSRDDYNSDLPYPYDGTDIVFSSNRSSNNFNIVSGMIDISYHEKDDVLNISIPRSNVSRILSPSFFQSINTENNELGPYSYHQGEDNLFMYASEESEQYKIKLVNITRWDYTDQQIADPVTLPTLSDIGDNLYPSRGTRSDELLFCSNRGDSVFNIWSASYPSEITASVLLDGSISRMEQIKTLSSAYDDKCPYLKDNILLFSSNRPGGFGGFDLWYSRYVDDSWTKPINLGEKINSAYNEYRPIKMNFLTYDVMIFSSDRPEGKGGFDLYAVKLGLE